MPIKPEIAVAGLNVLGQGINAFSQARMNRKQMAFALSMYDRQRRDALTDWTMMNEYNSPANQMARFKEAGLNPNLIYGQTTEAGPVRSSSVESWNPKAPQFDLASPVIDYINLQSKQAGIDNTAEQTRLLLKQQQYIEAQTIGQNAQTLQTIQNTKGMEFDLGQRQRMADSQFEALQANISKTQADTEKSIVESGVMLERNEREALMNAQNLKKGVEEILNLREQRELMKIEQLQKQAQTDNIKAQTEEVWQRIANLRQVIRNLQNENTIQQFEIKMNKLGLTKGDKAYWRFLTQILEGGTKK